MKKIFIMTTFMVVFMHMFVQSYATTQPILQEPLNPALESSDPLTGFDSFTNVVIFIRFADEQNYNAPYDGLYYEDLFNATGDGVVSVRDYYLEVSYGQQNIISELILDENNAIIFYTDIYERSYYEPYSALNPNGYDESDYEDQAIREHGLLGRAINFVDENNFIDDTINLDVNNDGDLDALTFLVSGEDNGWSSLLWPHQWYMYTDYYEPDAPSIDGAKAYTYTFNLLGNSRNYDYKTSAGILAHETFHLLGAPDLYHYYSYGYLDNAGAWSLMDNNVPVPPHMLGYMKEQYGGWITDVTTITTSGTYTLDPIMDSANNLMRIDTGYSNEYVYLEYRVQEGDYESVIPQSGLLVYRVDKDYYGNESGYSNTDNGEGINEVFVFRPGVGDTTEPITFPEDGSSIDAGYLNQAALSNNNNYSEAGVDESFMLFHSDGTLMSVSITNVVEANGQITFDITMEVNININVKMQVDGYDVTSSEMFFDHPNLEYEATLSGASAYDVYMSLDGDEATLDDPLYDGSFIFNVNTPVIHISIYDGETLLDQKVFEPNFVSSIETNHDPYGNNVYLAWFIPASDNFESIKVIFNNLFETEEDYDYFYVSYNGNSSAYDGTSLRNQTLDLSSQTTGVWLEFYTDESVDEYYGVYADVIFEFVVELSPEESVFLNGSSSIMLSYAETYEELGVTFISGYEDRFEVIVSETIDPFVSGTYTVVYEIYEAGILVHTLTRNVTVLDLIAVSFDLPTLFEVELGTTAFDVTPFVSSVEHNGNDYTIDVTGEVLLGVLGNYELIVSVTDDYDQATSQSVTVSVIDTTAPEVTLLASLDTINLGSVYIDGSVEVSDFDDTTINTSTTLNTSEIGQYIYTYTVQDSSGNTTTISRIIHVVAPAELAFVMPAMLTTIEIGTPFIAPLCRVTLGNSIEACTTNSSDVDINVSGNYEMQFVYELGEVTYTYIWYVFVIESRGTNNNAIAFIPKKEGEWL